MVGLTSDDDYRIKVHCLRLGFQYVFEQDGPRRWFADAGSQILSDLFVRAEKVSVVSEHSSLNNVRLPWLNQ
jgi:hypothetical protein